MLAEQERNFNPRTSWEVRQADVVYFAKGWEDISILVLREKYDILHERTWPYVFSISILVLREKYDI